MSLSLQILPFYIVSSGKEHWHVELSSGKPRDDFIYISKQPAFILSQQSTQTLKSHPTLNSEYIYNISSMQTFLLLLKYVLESPL